MADPSGGAAATPNPPTGPVLGVERTDAGVVVRLGGELDLWNAEELRATLLACCTEQPARLVVDLSEVRFVDSTALGALIEARSRLLDRRAFMLAAPQLETRRALEVSGLDRHFALYATAAAALAAQL